MTIGPEPITSTWWMSSRLGTVLLPHQVDEPLEQRRGVVRPGRGLRGELDAERRELAAAQPLDDLVVEAHVADLDPPVGGVGRPVERRVDGEAVVVAGHTGRAPAPGEHPRGYG